MNGLTGAELIDADLRDLREGRETIEALLVAIAAPRLRGLGMDIPLSNWQYPQHQLYELLAKHDSDSAHSRYNALVRGFDKYLKSEELKRGITLRTKLEEFLSNLRNESQLVH